MAFSPAVKFCENIFSLLLQLVYRESVKQRNVHDFNYRDQPKMIGSEKIGQTQKNPVSQYIKRTLSYTQK